MTNTETTNPRTALRLASMSNEDLRNFVTYKDYWMSTPEKQARIDRHAEMCAAELVRRAEAGGR